MKKMSQKCNSLSVTTFYYKFIDVYVIEALISSFAFAEDILFRGPDEKGPGSLPIWYSFLLFSSQ